MNPKTFFPNLAGAATFCALVMAGCTTPEQRDVVRQVAVEALLHPRQSLGAVWEITLKALTS